ncbi:unnamed protein product [Spirodela intermedia]|uniref:Coatomer subunit delta n=1 Tax=Spirodela intermedia TaxID=51605 RepID=A0A7I8JVY6_SPIIN|nr:unnamed protein product [Spirodela intermedia]CAA6673622.1 unnamed protein product [Spirodela intermedia]
MVVLAASIIGKSGKLSFSYSCSSAALVSRQFVDMSRIRIEGLFAAFPKLVGTGKQHTFVETENVRYVYQPIEALYLLLVTNKQSNILEDLETLRLLSKLVSSSDLVMKFSPILYAFDLIFAFDEAISLGNKENVTVTQVRQYCEMESHEERLHKLVMQSKINEPKTGEKGGFMSMSSLDRIESSFNDMSISSNGSGFGSASGFGLSTDTESLSSKTKGRPPTSANAPPKGLGMKLGKTQRTNQFLESLKAEGEVIIEELKPSAIQSKGSLPPTDPVTLTIEEKLNVTIKRDGGVGAFDIHGTLAVQILKQDDGFIQLQVENRDIHGLSFRTHPNINKELFNNEHIIGLKDPKRPFPCGQNDVGLLKWRIQGMDEAAVPLTVNCWPSVSGNETFVNIEYEACELFDLHNVVISVPLPALRESPGVRQIDGEWRYDPRSSTLEWSVLLIDSSNRSGSMEFVVPPADTSVFFPISVRFTAASTFSDVKVTGVLPLQEGPPPKFTQRTQLITDNYQVI